MTKSKILLVGTYPLGKLIHGGRRRVNAIIKEYKKIFGKVIYSSVYIEDSYCTKVSKLDFKINYFPTQYKNILNDSIFLRDLVSGKAAFEDKEISKKLSELIIDFAPDFIQFEQFFIYFGLKDLLRKIKYRPVLIYSSHNIEYSMKYDILRDCKVKHKIAEKYKNLILEKEKEISNYCDIIISVSKAEKKQFIEWGARDVILAPNGVYKKRFSKKNNLKWEKFFKNKNIKKFAIYVASDHSPCLYGFEKLLGWDINFLKKNETIVIVGCLGDYIKQYLSDKDKKQKTNILRKFEKKVLNLCQVEEIDLAILLQLAEVIILPILNGGGTNLKTAEALISNKKIIATHHSFRGFEKYKNLSGIYFADTKSNFVNLLSRELNTSKLIRSKKEKEIILEVLWENSLKKLKESLIHYNDYKQENNLSNFLIKEKIKS